MKKVKFLHVTMLNGDVYSVPAEIIAANRAQYYAEKEGSGDPHDRQIVYDEEYNYAMNTDDEVQSWAENNMNWHQVKAHAILEQKRPPLTDEELQEGWVNGSKWVTEKDK